jgi:hypothetical protein
MSGLALRGGAVLTLFGRYKGRRCPDHLCLNPAASTSPLLVGLVAPPPAMPRTAKLLVFFEPSSRPPSSSSRRRHSRCEAAAPPPPPSLVIGVAPALLCRSHHHLCTAGAAAIQSCAVDHGPAPQLVHCVGRAMAFGHVPGRALRAPVGYARRGRGLGGAMCKRAMHYCAASPRPVSARGLIPYFPFFCFRSNLCKVQKFVQDSFVLRKL